jgi:predicted kinase
LSNPRLYIFSGLPASGKSTLAQLLAKHIGAIYVRVDTVEQGLRDLCGFTVEGEGYHLSYRIISDNLKLGISAVSDSCNPIELTRDQWQKVATSVGAHFTNIEICCSNSTEHKYRVKTRYNAVKNLQLPSWEQIQDRRYEPWDREVVQIDTTGKSVEQAFSELTHKLGV